MLVDVVYVFMKHLLCTKLKIIIENVFFLLEKKLRKKKAYQNLLKLIKIVKLFDV